MIMKYNRFMVTIFIWFFDSASSSTSSHIGKFENYPINISYVADNFDLNSIASAFSPRMDFDQWKPLTGRGDPLRNDPTYDYEPPVLEKVHYWADENLPRREKFPERKSEVLVLGISSRKPSIASRPLTPVKRPLRPPTFPTKYEDFSYKFSDHYPMTILVPPPPPPPVHQPSKTFVVSEEKILPTSTPPLFDTLIPKETTTPQFLTSFALQESNLIYQSSTTKQNWLQDLNKTTNLPNNTVSSDYAGWGPTTPFEDNNQSHNIISHTDFHNIEFTKNPLSYYKPILSEAPPPPPQTSSDSFTVSTFLPTVLPPTLATVENIQDIITSSITETIPETSTESQIYYKDTTTEKIKTESFKFPSESLPRPKPNIIEMLGPMISMPMITDPDRPEDHLYAHASNNIHIFKEPTTEDPINLEIMQTMQPPPPIKAPERSTTSTRQTFHVNPHMLNNVLHENPKMHTHDPYLHMRSTTPTPTTLKASQDVISSTESPAPTYLIIQGHSKVKTYGSKPKPVSGVNTNEISNPKETNEVKHLHPIKDKHVKKSNEIGANREMRAQNLKSLVDNGLGSIEIQETDLGIKYDVSDGSEVPVEIYRKGIVNNDENNYSSSAERRNKRRAVLDSIEDFVYKIFEERNETVTTERIAQKMTNDSKSSSNKNFDVDNQEGDNDR